MKIMDRIFFAAAAAALAASLLVGCGASSAASSTASSAASSEAVSSVAASGEAVSEASDAKIKAQFTVTGADGESQTFDLEATDVGVADIQLHDGDSYAFTYTK